eukprot:5095518-Pyramimonas_sp.AAC.1
MSGAAAGAASPGVARRRREQQQRATACRVMSLRHARCRAPHLRPGSGGASEVSELRRAPNVMKQKIAELRVRLASAGHLSFSEAVH